MRRFLFPASLVAAQAPTRPMRDDGAPEAGRARYSRVAMLLHWLVGLLIVANLGIGLRMANATGLARFNIFQLHKSIGISVLLLAAVRLVWRLSHRPPAYPQGMARAERRAASSVHAVLYALMIVLPITGWVVVSASLYNLPTLLFRTVPWPHIGFVHDLPAATRRLVESRAGTVHAVLAWSLLALAVAHAAAALKHQVLDRDDLLARMLPSWGRAQVKDK